MSERLKQIQGDMVAAMKAQDTVKKTVLSTLIAKVKTAAKNDKNREPTDNDVVQAVRKTIKEVNETRGFAEKRGDDTDALDREIEIVSSYLPSQMTEGQLRATIEAVLATTDKGKAARGVVMKALKAQHEGFYDPASANAILGELLA